MQADVQNQGYAAGCLAAKCAASGEDFRAVDVKAFQHELVQIGILDPATASARDSFPMSPESIREAAHGDLATAKEVAILFANPELSKPLLAARVRDEIQIEKRRTAALILGLMGDPACGPTLMEWVSTADWDEGWNYRGMGQFGRSMSSLDAAILALGRAQVHGAGPLLAKLADALGPDAAFSHCRCLALAAGMLKDPALTKTLLRLLDLPDFCGHAFQSPENILADNDPDPTFTASRNLALRELYVARGLFLAGTQDPRPREILENYAGDLRGHFARHAADLLAHGADPGDDLLELA
jgi:hypothetical protein